MELRGEIDLILLAEEYENRGMRNQRLITIQTLANTTKTGSYDPNTVNSLENNLLAKGIIYQTGEHSLTVKDIQALTARYGEYPEGGKKFTHSLENGGDMIFTGAEILAGGVLDRLAKKTKLDEERFQQKEPEGLEKPDEAVPEENLSDQRQQIHTENSNAGKNTLENTARDSNNAINGEIRNRVNITEEGIKGSGNAADDALRGGKNAAGGVAEGNKNVIYEVAEGTTGGVDDVIKGGKGTSGIPVPEKVKAANGLNYESYSKHTLGQSGNRRNAGLEPKNSLQLFEKSVTSTSSKYANTRFTYDETTGTLHRFFNDGNDVWHWSGSTNQGANSLTSKQVPIDIIRLFNLPRKGW